MTTKNTKSRKGAQPTTLLAAIEESVREAAERRLESGSTVQVSRLARGTSYNLPGGYRLEEFIGSGATRRRCFTGDYDTLAELQGFAPDTVGLDEADWRRVGAPKASH